MTGVSLTHDQFRSLRRFPALDGLRAVSILLVILAQFPEAAELPCGALTDSSDAMALGKGAGWSSGPVTRSGASHRHPKRKIGRY